MLEAFDCFLSISHARLQSLSALLEANLFLHLSIQFVVVFGLGFLAWNPKKNYMGSFKMCWPQAALSPMPIPVPAPVLGNLQSKKLLPASQNIRSKRAETRSTCTVVKKRLKALMYLYEFEKVMDPEQHDPS